MIRWDGMHVINLGVDLWVTASVIKKLLQYDGVFGGLDVDEGTRLLTAYDLFRAWCRINKVQYPSLKIKLRYLFSFFPIFWGGKGLHSYGFCSVIGCAEAQYA